MKSYALHSFWECYNRLPEHIRKLADKNFELFSENQSPDSSFVGDDEFYYLTKYRAGSFGQAGYQTLNIPRYVESKNDQVVLTVDAAMKQLRASATVAFAAEEKLIGILKREELLK